MQHETPELEVANLYANWKSSFKPAAPNLTEAEGAEILHPEQSHSVEAGFKTRALNRQLSLDASWFDMTFENLVVSALGPDTLPTLINAGKERFKGFEVNLGIAPDFVSGTTLTDEYWVAHRELGFAWTELVEIADTGFRAAFLPPDEKAQLIDRVRAEIAASV